MLRRSSSPLEIAACIISSSSLVVLPLLLLLLLSSGGNREIIVTVEAVNPLRFTGSSEHCFPPDQPDDTICYPTRCLHLFNRSTHGVYWPTPARYPQRYPHFGCNVTSFHEYFRSSAGGVLEKRRCKKPVCYCRSLWDGGSCNPTKFNDCAQHSCRYRHL